jgi:hypothetical protein
MQKLALVGAVLLAGVIFSGTAGAVVVLGRTGWSGPSSGSYTLTKTGTYATFEVISSTVIEPQFVALGGPIKVFVVSEGTEFTADYLATHTSIFESSPAPITIGFGQSLYLAIYTPQFMGNPDEQFSWVRIRNNLSSIGLAEEATSVGGGGIIVGTTTEIPEPGTMLLGTGFMAIVFRRRRFSCERFAAL